MNKKGAEQWFIGLIIALLILIVVIIIIGTNREIIYKLWDNLTNMFRYR